MPNAKTPRTLDDTQQLLLLEALRRDKAPTKTFRKGIRNYLMGCLMLDAGMRVGEVVQIKVSHLWFNGKPVRTLLLTGDITKNKKERTVPVSERLAKAIEEFFARALGTVDCDPSYRLFLEPRTGRCLTTRQVENIMNTAASKSLGRLITPHMLRHTFGSKLMRVTNIRTVQELLGHNYVTSTQIYTHPNEEDKRKAVEEVSDIDRILNTEAHLPL